MKRSSWLNGFWQTLQQKDRRRSDANVTAESLETRQLLSTSALFIHETGELNIEIGSNDNIRLRAQNGNVRVEQEGPTGTFTPLSNVGTLSASLVRLITIAGGDEANTIDLNGVTATTFPQLTLIDVDAGNGHDTIIGSPDLNDSLIGGHGHDTILGQGGNDTIIGGDGDDSILGDNGNDSIQGGDGQDTIVAGTGDDVIQSGDGTDSVSGGDGNDSVFAGNGQDVLHGDAGNDTLNGDGGIDTLNGGDGNDSMLGGELNDLLSGDAGNDTLIGNAGDDTLIGVSGSDQADGGVGHDLILSSLDVLENDDPVPAAPIAVAPTPVPLSDATDSTLGVVVGGPTHTIASGTGDGSVSVVVTSTGAFGTGRAGNSTAPGALFDPVGTVGQGETTVDSEVYFRSNTLSGTRATLESLATNRSSIRGFASDPAATEDNEANSSFEIGSLRFALTQVVEPAFDLVTGQQTGSLLTQTYRITNRGTTASEFELVRFFDGSLQFDGTIADGGGRLLSAAGDEFLYETDAGGLSVATNYVGITSKGGTAPISNRLEIDPASTLQASIQNGTSLDGQILNDTDGDQSIDTDGNVSLALRNTYNLLPNETGIFTTHTLFGTGTPNTVQVNQKPVAVAETRRTAQGRDLLIDVVSNDFDLDGSVVNDSVQIVQQPAFGTVTALLDGRVLYTPNPGFARTDSFAYTIADNLGARSAPALVTLTVVAPDTVGDSLNGGLDNDTVIGGDGNDTIFGGAGNDSLLGGGGNDLANGQSGQDTIEGGGGVDNLQGGAGRDLINSVRQEITIEPVTGSLPEGDTGTTDALFTVSLSFASALPVLVDFTAQTGTALAETDFQTTSGQLIFAPGETTKTIAVPVIGDTDSEADELFFVVLSNPVNAPLGVARANVTILNDEAPPVPASLFDIVVVFSGGLTATQQAAFTAAEQRLESIIIGDVPDFFVTGIGLVDDVQIDASGAAIDGVNGILGQAGPIDLRPVSFLPATGSMQFDTADLAALEASGQLVDTILHEMMHVLGFGTIWTNLNLLQNPSAGGGTDPRFIGPLATAEYNTRFAANDTGVPVEATGGPGTADGHWRETIFVNELMTGFIDPGVNPISRVTIAQFADLGYQVNLAQADTYLRAANLTTRSNAVGGTVTRPKTRVMAAQATTKAVTSLIEPAADGDTLAGGDGDDTLQGAGGNDFLNGGQGNDLMNGADGDDFLLGGAGADTLLGGNGNDTLDGQGGNDSLNGGEGDDIAILTFGGGNDTVSSDGGLDVATVNANNLPNAIAVSQANGRLVVSLGIDSLTVDGSVQYTVVNALGGNDTVTVSDLNTVSGSLLTVNGGVGDDLLDAFGAQLGIVHLRINGDAGNDTLNGSLSGETLDGGAGDDSVCGWAGNDTLLGGDGNDSLGGSLGNDTIDGGNGADLLNGQQGDDSVLGNLGHDTLKGEDGNDTLSGQAGDDNLNGMAGNDSLLGGVGRDALSGGAGNDSLDGGRNDDTLGGSSGDDLIFGDHGHDQINAGDGNNTVIAGDGNDTVFAGLGNDFVSGGDGHDKISTDSGDDVITGGDGNDTVNAGAGNDIVLGGDGDDILNGQGGTDTLAGNQGTDFISDPTTEIDETFVLSSLLLAAFQRV